MPQQELANDRASADCGGRPQPQRRRRRYARGGACIIIGLFASGAVQVDRAFDCRASYLHTRIKCRRFKGPNSRIGAAFLSLTECQGQVTTVLGACLENTFILQSTKALALRLSYIWFSLYMICSARRFGDKTNWACMVATSCRTLPVATRNPTWPSRYLRSREHRKFLQVGRFRSSGPCNTRERSVPRK